MRRRSATRGGTAVRILVVLTAAGGCAAAVAYAASLPPPVEREASGGESFRGELRRGARAKHADGGRPTRPRIKKHPERTSTSTRARFAFAARGRGLRFQCRRDQARWRECSSPLVLRGLALGTHRFSVRAVRRARHGAAAVFVWTVVEAKPLSIEPQLSGIADLYPGAGPVELPVLLSNPNSVPILVTSLTVAVVGNPPGCDSATNFESIASSISADAPLRLPVGASTRLPAPGVAPPAIALRDLTINQDACQGARLPLSFSGEAHG
jgi:hypothetical protein